MLTLKLPVVLLALAAGTSGGHSRSAPANALPQSPDLWATVDVCNPKDQPNTIGIRGSMPGDGHPADLMFMRLRVQYQNSSTKKWADIAKGPGSQGADSGFQQVKRGAVSQWGVNFQLVPTPGGVFTLRGVVSFQWRRGARVVHAATRVSTANHKSLQGADPAGFSAATCTIR